MREIIRVNQTYAADHFVIYASATVTDALMNEESHALAELKFSSAKGQNSVEPLYHQEQFDVVMMW